MFKALLSGVPALSGRASSVLEVEKDNVISINVEAVYALLPAKPHLPWRQVVGLCGSTLGPAYRAVHSTVLDEFENMAHFFAELNFDEMPTGDTPPYCDTSSSSSDSHGEDDDPKIPLPTNGELLIIQNADASIPTIIIHPCETPSREHTCCAPLQDACFGKQLVVPAHPVVNQVFPPLLARPLPLTRRWEYTNGHWRAILPTVEEQVRRGWLTRSLSVRRRPWIWR